MTRPISFSLGTPAVWGGDGGAMGWDVMGKQWGGNRVAVVTWWSRNGGARQLQWSGGAVVMGRILRGNDVLLGYVRIRDGATFWY